MRQNCLFRYATPNSPVCFKPITHSGPRFSTGLFINKIVNKLLSKKNVVFTLTDYQDLFFRNRRVEFNFRGLNLMELLALREANPAMAVGHRFVINLKIPKGGPVQVRSCEVIGTQYRNRFTFPSRVTISDVFVDPVVRGVTTGLASLSNTTEVMSLPSLILEMPGLTLAKVHLVTSLADDGQLDVILRFKMVLGSVSRAFKTELGIEDAVPDYSAHMSAMVLTDIVMPLLDLCSVAEAEGRSDDATFDKFMDTLADRSREVRFQAELIKRFVGAASKPAAQTMRISTDQPPQRLTKRV